MARVASPPSSSEMYSTRAPAIVRGRRSPVFRCGMPMADVGPVAETMRPMRICACADPIVDTSNASAATVRASISSAPCHHAGQGLQPHFRGRTVSNTSRPEDTMRRRLYFIMPDVASARTMMDDLLLARVEERHIHFLAKRGTPMDGLHEANHLQKSDLVHGAQVGLALGALLGVILGAVVVMTMGSEDRFQIVIVLGSGLAGALFGAWVSSMVGSAVPNSRLKQFSQAIESGRILLMADVPQHRVNEVREQLAA